MASAVPPQLPPDFSTSADSILSETKALLCQSETLRNEVVARVLPEDARFSNVVRPLIDDANRTARRLNILGTLSAEASPDPALRNAAQEAQRLISDARATQLMRGDVASLVGAVHQRGDADGQLDAQDVHLVTVMYSEMMRSGALLQDVETKQRLRNVKSEIEELQVAAVKTLTHSDEGGVWFIGQELQGMSDKVLSSLETRKATADNDCGDLEYFASYKASVHGQMASSVSSAAARRRYTVASRRRHPENAVRLARLVVLRDEMARILGFDHYAAMKMEELMASSVADVLGTLYAMVDKMKPLADAESSKLLEVKAGESEPNDEHGTACLDEGDWGFYARKFRAKNNVGGNVTAEEYFEVYHTWSRTLDLFSRLFQIKFLDSTGQISVWHDSVKTYSVWDGADGDGEFLGYLYVDLFEREGKYQNQRHVSIEPSFVTADGTHNYPSSALLCSFPTPSPADPTLLSLFNVRTMFHELGHCMHNILSRTKYAIPSSRDYVEIPSVLLENWGWEADILASVARHHKIDAGQDAALPEEVLSSILGAKGCFGANNMMPLLQRAIFDLIIHSPRTHEEALSMDVTNIWNTTRSEIAGQSKDPEDWGWEQAQFGHLFRKYSAGFFAYATAKAYGSDLYSSYFADDPLNPERMNAWRRQVLERGSSLPESDILEGFMGRKLNVETLMQEILRDSCSQWAT